MLEEVELVVGRGRRGERRERSKPKIRGNGGVVEGRERWREEDG